MIESCPGSLIELRSKEFKFSSTFGSLFASVFHFKTWFQKCEVLRDLEVELEHGSVCVESEPENWRSSWIPHAERLHLSVLVKVLIIVAEFSL